MFCQSRSMSGAERDFLQLMILRTGGHHSHRESPNPRISGGINMAQNRAAEGQRRHDTRAMITIPFLGKAWI